MADGTTINAGSGGDVIATDDIASGVAAGQKVQRAKSGWGSDGTYVDTDTTNPLPVRATGAQASGSALTGNPVLVGGSDGTNVRNIRTDNGGGVLVRITNSSLSAIEIADNAGFTDGTSSLIMAGFAFDETAGTALTENDAAAARVDSKRAQVMVVEDATTRGQRQSVDPNGAAKVAGVGVVTITTSYTRPADTTAYAASDAMSNSTSSPSVLTFTSLASASGKSGIITDLFVSSTAAAAMSGELWLFDTSPTAINDNAAFALNDADAQKAIAKIPFTTSVDATNNAVAHVSNLGIGYTGSGSANIYGLVRVTQAYTPANAEVVQFRLKALQVN